MELPKQIQDKLAQFQELQNQLQMFAMQKQQLSLQSADIANALSELETVGDEKIYELTGPLFIETNKEDSKKKLEEKKEVSATRLKMFEKQENKLTSKLEELGSELQALLGGSGLGGLGGQGNQGPMTSG